MEVNELLDDIDRRLHELYNLVNSNSGGLANTNIFDEIIILPPGGGTAVLDQTSSPPTGLTIAPAAYYSNSYADISWTPPSDGSAIEYDVLWARRTGSVGSYVYETVNVKRVHGNTLRIENLFPGEFYGVRITGFNRIGWPSVNLPASGFQDFQAASNTTGPSAPTGLAVTAGIKTLIARWNENPEPDVARGAGQYKIEVSSNSGFSAIVKTSFLTGRVASFNDLTSNVQYWIRVTAINSSGASSLPSSTATATTGQGMTVDIAADQIVTNHMLANSIDADRVTSNTMDVVKLMTSTLTAADVTINGGSLKAGNPGGGVGTHGVLINSQGIRVYNGTTVVVALDVGGTATFGGSITSTATISGSSIVGASISGGTITGAVFDTWNHVGSQPDEIVIDPSNLTGPTGGILFYSSGTSVYHPAQHQVTAGAGHLIRSGAYASTGYEAYLEVDPYASGSQWQYGGVFIGSGGDGLQVRTTGGDNTYSLAPTIMSFYAGSGGPGGNTGAQAVLGMMAANGSAGIAASTDGTNEYQMNITDYYNTTFTDIRAASFIVASSRTLKKMAKPNQSSLDVVVAAPSWDWTYNKDVAVDDKSARFGPVAEDFPVKYQRHGSIKGKPILGIDLATQVGILWEAVRELAAKVN